MDDVVALKVTLSSGEERLFLTWGRVLGATAETELASAARPHVDGYNLGGSVDIIRVCPSLQEAARAPYFFEAFVSMCQERIPYGSNYQAWLSRKKRDLSDGKGLIYLGTPEAPNHRQD